MQPDSSSSGIVDAPTTQDTVPSRPSETARTNAMLAWIFAPFTSFLWKDDPDKFIRSHADESLYIGIAQIAAFAVILLLQACFTATFFGSFGLGMIGFAGLFGIVLNILWFGFWAFTFVTRIAGAINANNGQYWKLREVSDVVRKFVKL